jgi:hypothetical protein
MEPLIDRRTVVADLKFHPLALFLRRHPDMSFLWLMMMLEGITDQVGQHYLQRHLFRL